MAVGGLVSGLLKLLGTMFDSTGFRFREVRAADTKVHRQPPCATDTRNPQLSTLKP